jgi:hypothetical protein
MEQQLKALHNIIDFATSMRNSAEKERVRIINLEHRDHLRDQIIGELGAQTQAYKIMADYAKSEIRRIVAEERDNANKVRSRYMPTFPPELDNEIEFVDVNDPEKGLIATLKEIGLNVVVVDENTEPAALAQFFDSLVDPRDAQEPHSVQDLPDEGVGI